jgi:hypothetical protein
MKFGTVASVIGSAVSFGTFWISKELQYDLFITSIPFLYLAFACLVNARERKINTFNYVLFGVFTFLSLLLTSIQGFILSGLVFFLVLVAYFIARGWTLWKDRHFWVRLLLVGFFAYALASLLTFPSFLAFLESSERYVPVTNLGQEIIFAIKRLILPLLTSITFSTANLFGNFDTIDPFKNWGSLGGREYGSIDTLTLYCGSVYVLSLGFIILNSWQKRPRVQGFLSSPAFRFWFICFVGAWIICTLPTYKFLYFRFLQFTIGFSAPIFVALALEEIAALPRRVAVITFKQLAILGAIMWAGIVIVGRIVSTDKVREIVLSKLGTGGMLGFESGFWESRYQRFAARLSLQDSYSISLLLVPIFLFIALYFYIIYCQRPVSRRSIVGWALALVLVQSVMLVDSFWHTWNWQWPQPTRLAWIIENPYWKQKGVKGLTEIDPYNAPIPNANFLILYGVQPPTIYDSLQVEPERK